MLRVNMAMTAVLGRTVRASAHGEMKRKNDGCWIGRTDRASLHYLN